MNRDRVLIVGSALAVLAIVVGAPIVFGRLDFFATKFPASGTVVASSISPDSTLTADVFAADSAGHYIFVLRHDRDVLARREISAPVGYHAQLVRVEWTPNGDSATATIDHDFGEKNVRVTLARPLMRKGS